MGQLEQFYNRYQYNTSIAKNSMQWYRRQATEIQMYGIKSDTVLREGGEQTTSIVPGSMYMYYYNPKYRETLEYYDNFPMVIPYAKTSNGFMGLNLHYVPPKIRVVMLDKLLEHASNPNLSKTTRILYTWQIAKSISNQPWAEACIHRYLDGYVMSRFVKIDPKNWVNACMLPVQRFKKATAEEVWRKSLNGK